MACLKWCIGLLLFTGLVAGEIKNKGWWKNTVFYQVYPRSFMDANNDGNGDLKGIISKLQHFKASGIGAIWLSPIYKSPKVDNGYDISDFRDIDPIYGTMLDLEELTKKAKELGIKIIMDLVPNHTSDQHEWFKKSLDPKETKYKDYYVWRDAGKPEKVPNNWLSVFNKSAWTYNGERGAWYFHQFYAQQPDLNYKNTDVKKEMEDIIKFWLGKGIDGFRIDAVPHIYENDEFLDEPLSETPGVGKDEYGYLNHIYTKDDPRTYNLIREWRKVLDDYADKNNLDEKIIMTEAYTSLQNTILFYNYGSNIPFNFNFIMNVNSKSKPTDFKKVIDDWMNRTPRNESANWVMGNHDRSRTATRYPGRADQMTMLAMILPGIAVTYNGEEIGMEDNPDACTKTLETKACDFRDPARSPFLWDNTANAGFSNATKTWLPVHKNYTTTNLAHQKIDLVSHYKIYQKLTELRSKDTLKNGDLQAEVLNDGNVLAVVRGHGDKKQNVILLVNFSDDKEQSVDIKAFTSSDHSKTTFYVSSIGSNISWNSTVDSLKVKLPAKASVVVHTSSGAPLNTAVKTIIVTSLLALIKFL